MEKYNNIKNTDQFHYLTSIFSQIELLVVKSAIQTEISRLKSNIEEFAGHEFMAAIRFRKDFSVIQDYCEKFFDCKEEGLSYQLGCRYQNIDFTSSYNIDAEISFLEALLEVYNPKFKGEITLIKFLILDLQKFKVKFEEYDLTSLPKN